MELTQFLTSKVTVQAVTDLIQRFRRDHPGIELRMQVTHDKQRLLERLTGAALTKLGSPTNR